MKGFSVVEVLQVSFAGIAFILAFLAYRLLSKEAEREQSRPNVLKSIKTYMIFAFSMGCLAIGAQMVSSILNPPAPEDIIRRVEALAAKVTQAEKGIDRANSRISGISLVAKDAGASSPYSCGQEQKSEPATLTVMSGLRDGTSCKVQNVNYYKELSLAVPK